MSNDTHPGELKDASEFMLRGNIREWIALRLSCIKTGHKFAYIEKLIRDSNDELVRRKMKPEDDGKAEAEEALLQWADAELNDK
jgi:hypothetical protein